MLRCYQLWPLDYYANPHNCFFKVILDPNLDWDKRFLSPASSKKSKACLDDKAIFWKPTASSKTNKDAKIKAPPVIKQSENDTPYNPYSCKPKANITCEKNLSLIHI